MGVEVDSHLSSKKSNTARVPMINLASKPVERLVSGAGALPLSSVQRCPGLGSYPSVALWLGYS